MDKHSHIRYWIETSDRDYLTMTSLFRSKDFAWALFIGHLVLEKLFKAIYVQKMGAEAPRIHDLVRLAEKWGLPLNNVLLDKLEMITRFNLNVRYPDYQQEFYKLCTESFSVEALNSIDEVRQWLKQSIQTS